MMTPLPPYPPPSEFEERAERAQAAFDLAYKNSQTVRARRNRALLILYAVVCTAVIFIGGALWLWLNFGWLADVGWLAGWFVGLAVFLWIAAARTSGVRR